MTTFITILINNVLPAFVVMGAGVVLDRTLHVDKKTLSRTAIYILTPCLVFSSIVQSDVEPAQFGLMILFVLAITGVMCAIAMAVGHLLRWPERTIDALVLSVAFVNAGNYGLSIIQFTFGMTALELAAVYFVTTKLTGNSVAAFFAARGSRNGRQALLQVFRLPGIYAFALAIVLRSVHFSVPDAILKPSSLIGSASIPIMLLMLGIQLSQTHVAKRYKQVSVAVLLRLAVGPLVAFGLAPILGLQGLARQVAIAESSTPTAVSSALMAIEFDADAEFVSSTIFISTLLSSVTMSIILATLVA